MNDTDHVVIGAGLVGLATALALADAGARVIVVERATVGAGASGGPGLRGIRSNARHPAELALAADALRRWPELDRTLGHPTGFEQRGGIELYDADDLAADGGVARLRARAEVQNRAGVASEILDRGDLADRLGPLGDRIAYGILVETDGVAPPAVATAAFAAAARSAGVTILEQTRALQIQGAAQAPVVETDAGTISADSVAVCANTGARPLVAASTGIDLPLWEVGLHVHFLEPESPWALPHLIGHDSRPLAAKTVAGGAAQVSGFLKARLDAAPEAMRYRDAMFLRSEQLFRQTFPDFPPARCAGREGRAEAFTLDGLQIIDRMPGRAPVFVATGWCGHGFATAPAVGAALAEWMLTTQRPPILAPFALDRW